MEKQTNFKIKGTIDYEIIYEGDQLKIISNNTDETALVHALQTLIRINQIKENIRTTKTKKSYTTKDRLDVIATSITLNKIVTNLGQRAYRNMMIANTTPEERASMEESDRKAMEKDVAKTEKEIEKIKVELEVAQKQLGK